MTPPSTEWIADPPFDIVRTQHIELVVTDLDAARDFYVDMLGLALTEATDDALYLRAFEERLHHSLVLRLGDEPMMDHAAFRVRRPEELEKAADYYESIGCTPELVHDVELGQGPALRVHDQMGFPLEFFYEMEHVESLLQQYHLYRPSRLMRLDHVNFYAADVVEAYESYRQLGFRCSEYISRDSDDRLASAWLYRKSTVHDVALTSGRGPRLHHIAYTSSDSRSVTDLCDQIAGAHREACIERGPGRHGVSSAFFVYLRDPDGHRIELYACDYYTGDPDHKPLRWSVSDPRCRSFWGARAPDSWYEESTVVLGPDGAPTETIEANVDERLARSEAMA
jgi:catechol 2,3-dioxygenase